MILIFVSHLTFEHWWGTTPHIHGFHLVFTSIIIYLIVIDIARGLCFLSLLSEAQGGQELPGDTGGLLLILFLCLFHHLRGIGIRGG
jgi:hypothetical protein